MSQVAFLLTLFLFSERVFRYVPLICCGPQEAETAVNKEFVLKIYILLNITSLMYILLIVINCPGLTA